MKSITNLFRVGPGPSSSHTIAPSCAAKAFKRFIKEKGKITVTLYGSLAFTGSGHRTQNAIEKALKPFDVEFILKPLEPTEHPLKMVYDFAGKTQQIHHIYYSLGGGEISSPTDAAVNEIEIYPFKNFDSIKRYMIDNEISDFKELCKRFEPDDIDDRLMDILEAMFSSVEEGLSLEGMVPTNDNPKLRYERCAKQIRDNALSIPEFEAWREMLITAYAYSVAENSASGIDVVTAPTCGSSGVLPGILYFGHKHMHIPMETLRDALYVAGMIGNVVKQNASIAGSVGGCQAEIGTASSMAAAALSFIVDPESIYQMEYAAECAMEHFLGLSCDPVDGYVVIPCIERNGMGALRAYDAFLYAKYISPLRKNQVSFDDVVSAMKITGDSLSDKYKETAQGGLAEILKKTNSNC